MAEKEKAAEAQREAEKAARKPPDSEEDGTCGRCDKGFNKSGSLQCCVCKLWMHKACTQLNNDAFKAMCKMWDDYGYHGWACPSCGKSTLRLDTIVKNLEGRMTNVENQLKQIAPTVEKVNELSTELSKVSVDVDKLKKNGNLDQLKRDMLNEQNEQATRRDNLIFHNVPEIDDSVIDIKGKRDAEVKNIDDICIELNMNFRMDDDIKFVKRVGARRDDGNPRPLIAGFRDRAFRDRLLNMQFKLKRSRNLSLVRIVADLTKNQRDNELAMEAECKKRNIEITNADKDATFLWVLVGPKGQKRMIQQERGEKRSREGSPQSEPARQRLRSQNPAPTGSRPYYSTRNNNGNYSGNGRQRR